jgi:hypothetical protein
MFTVNGRVQRFMIWKWPNIVTTQLLQRAVLIHAFAIPITHLQALVIQIMRNRIDL